MRPFSAHNLWRLLTVNVLNSSTQWNKNSNKGQSAHSQIQWLQHSGCEELRAVSQLVDICGTFQASSAERGFCLINRIKTTSRNRLEASHLDQLMQIKSRQEADGSHQPGQSEQPLDKGEGQAGKRSWHFKSLIRRVLVLLPFIKNDRNHHIFSRPRQFKTVLNWVKFDVWKSMSLFYSIQN